MQHDFENSLDVVGNIVSICPNCHRLIHYGRDKDKKKF
ncbi:restriction endonuclease [Bacillus thuringiensis]|nr:restriction endonuclease [Bacillus thuringiensis]